MSDISLSKGIRSNLLQLQNTADLIGRTQNRLATGKRVNSALDNPTNFFTSSALNSRANDLSNLLDALGNGIKTLEAADNGLKAITRTVESAQATLRQARQDKSFKTTSFTFDTAAIQAASIDTNAEATKISISGGAVGTTAVDIQLSTAQGKREAATNFANLDFAEAGDNLQFKIALNGGTQTLVKIENGTAANSLKITVGATATDNLAVVAENAVTGAELSAHLTTALAAGGVNASAAGATGSKLTFTATAAGAADANIANVAITDVTVANGGAGTALAAADFGFAAAGTATITNVTTKTVDALVTAITATSSLTNKVKASNDGGKLRLENLSTESLTVVGATAASVINGGTGASNTTTIGGNEVRKNLVGQFNELRTQLDKLSDDSSFNGINLLKGDKLKLNFNEIGTSSIEIQAKDTAGNVREISASKLGITSVATGEFSDDATIDARLQVLSDALTTLRSQSSTFGSNLSVVQNRTDFTKSTINTLRTGADGLTLADQNEEAANLLSLQTRQQLASTALSLANQADQGVLRLF